jgi:hypothetical protein
VKDVQVVNDYTVRFITEKPWPGLIDRIAATDFLPMPPKALKEQGVQALAAKPIGTGPFKFVQWVRDEKLVMEKNPDYWQGAPDLNRVTFRFIPEFSAGCGARRRDRHHEGRAAHRGDAREARRGGAEHGVLADNTLACQPEARPDGTCARAGDSPRCERRRADPAGAWGRATKMCGPLSLLNATTPLGECIATILPRQPCQGSRHRSDQAQLTRYSVWAPSA